MAFDFTNPYGMVTGQPNIGPITPQPQPQPQPTPNPMGGGKNDKLSLMLFALGGALKGDKNFVQNTMQLQQQQREQERLKLEKDRQKKLKEFSQTDPSLAKMFDLFGEKGLQQGYLRQLEALENEQARIGQISSFVNAGISYEDSVLLAAGLEPDDIKSLRQEENTAQKIIDNVNLEVDKVEKETKYQDAYADLDQAFGPQDAYQEYFINKPARFLFGADPAGATGAAIRSRNALNLEIKAILANDYTGKPSNLLLQEIEKIIPSTTATSEKDAFEKYTNILTRTKSRAKNLEQGILSEITSNADKEQYREQLFKTKELEKKLEAAVMSLKGKEKITLEASKETPDSLEMTGKYSNLYLRDY